MAVVNIANTGAVFGVGGALAVFFYRHKGYFGKTSDAVLQSLGQSLVINLGYGLVSRSVDNWCVAGTHTHKHALFLPMDEHHHLVLLPHHLLLLLLPNHHACK